MPTIPLRALVPKGSRNLMVAGRSISSDRAANSGLRVQGTCMAMGQAAGAAAALAAQSGKSPLEVSLDAIKVLLRKHHAVVPGGDVKYPESHTRHGQGNRATVNNFRSGGAGSDRQIT